MSRKISNFATTFKIKDNMDNFKINRKTKRDLDMYSHFNISFLSPEIMRGVDITREAFNKTCRFIENLSQIVFNSFGDDYEAVSLEILEKRFPNVWVRIISDSLSAADDVILIGNITSNLKEESAHIGLLIKKDGKLGMLGGDVKFMEEKFKELVSGKIPETHPYKIKDYTRFQSILEYETGYDGPDVLCGEAALPVFEKKFEKTDIERLTPLIEYMGERMYQNLIEKMEKKDGSYIFSLSHKKRISIVFNPEHPGKSGVRCAFCASDETSGKPFTRFIDDKRELELYINHYTGLDCDPDEND